MRETTHRERDREETEREGDKMRGREDRERSYKISFYHTSAVTFIKVTVFQIK